MRYYIIAGEASGDLYGSRLIDEIKSIDKKDICDFNPDKIIYIDYPGFNLLISKWAKKKGFKNYYYISPQIWAWKENRIKTIKENIDKLYVIFPFEREYYSDRHNLKSEFYGHPLIEQIDNFKTNFEFYKDNNISNEKEIITLLPGSRSQEINSMLPIFLTLKKHFSKYEFIIAGVKNVDESIYKKALEMNVKVIYDQTYDLLYNSKAAIVTSGTASLECALFKVPQIVCYKTSFISYLIGKTFIKINFISLVNIILKQKVVQELIQNQLTEDRLLKELNVIIEGKKRSIMLDHYSKIYSMLSLNNTSHNIANSIIKS